MTERALKDLGWSDFRAAAWWFGLLYRRPRHFRQALEKLTNRQALEELPKMRTVQAGVILITHALIYVIIIAAAGRWLLFGGLGFPLQESANDVSNLLLAQTEELAGGIAAGIAAGIALGIVAGIGRIAGGMVARGIAAGVAIGIVGGIFGGIIGGINEGFVVEIASGIAYGIAGAITYGIAVGMAAGIAGGIFVEIAMEIGRVVAFGITAGIVVGMISGIAAGIAGGITVGIAVVIALLRAQYYPWHLMLLLFAPTATGYRWHPVAWDDMCFLPFSGLDRFLLALWDASPEIGEREIERLISSYPSQRMEALKARVAVIAREAKASENLARLDDIVNRLAEGGKGYLAETPRVREMVARIAEAQRRVDSVDRPFLRQPYAEAIVMRIEAFHVQISGFHEPLFSEFRKAADAWLKRAQAQLEQIKKITGREPRPQVFRAGDPVDRSQEAFVPRMGVIGQVERQVTLASGCPSLLIYGRRRMGKSTLIRNLDAFVPASVCIASVSMQNPNLFCSTAYFVGLIDKEVSAAIKDQPAGLKSEDLGGLFERLSSANSWLEYTGLRLIMAVDEFENIDTKIGEGVFSPDLLATIRELIQSHRRLIWVFAGSHRVTMLRNAEWPSYLISVQTIEIPPFTETETRLLLTDPLRLSPLYSRDAERRPRFNSNFWGEGGIAWIHAQTAGWPHLVQLLASGAVDFANELETTCLNRQALEEVARRAIVSGDMVFHQLVHGESQSEAERAYIAGFRTRDRQSPPEDDATLRSLRLREIIAEDGSVWRLKVPLMQQWLRTRG